MKIRKMLSAKAKAAAWDEGYEAAKSDAFAISNGFTGYHANPYRKNSCPATERNTFEGTRPRNSSNPTEIECDALRCAETC